MGIAKPFLFLVGLRRNKIRNADYSYKMGKELMYEAAHTHGHVLAVQHLAA